MRFTLSVLYLAIATTIPAFAQQAAVPKQALEVENCVVQYINKVDVPARAEGTLTELKVDEGVMKYLRSSMIRQPKSLCR